MDPNHSVVIQEVVAKLQGLLGGKTQGPAVPKEASIPQFDANLAKCVQKSQSLSPQIIKLTHIYETASKTMKLVLGYSFICKKFSTGQQEKLKQKFMNLSKEIDDIQKKSVDHIDHCKAVRQLLSTTFWVFVPTPQFLMKGAIESADFSARKFQMRKNLDHNDWYKLLQIAIKSLQKFVLEGYATGLTFNFNGQDKWNDLIQGTGPISQSSAPKQTVKQAEVKQPAVQIKKAKKRELVGQTYTICNFQNQVISFKAGELQMKHGIYLQNCNKVTLKIEPKFKSIVVSKCQAVIIEVKSCISGVEVVGCKDVSIFVHEKTPSISIDNSQTVRLVLNQNNLECDIVSSKASELTIAYEKGDGNQSKPFMVGEQLITKWNQKTSKFQTSVYDKFL